GMRSVRQLIAEGHLAVADCGRGPGLRERALSRGAGPFRPDARASDTAGCRLRLCAVRERVSSLYPEHMWEHRASEVLALPAIEKDQWRTTGDRGAERPGPHRFGC